MRILFSGVLFLTLFLWSDASLQAKDFMVSDGNVYGTDGLIEAIQAANTNNENTNTIHLANGGQYNLDSIYGDVVDTGINFGPVGLPAFASNKTLIIEGNGASITRNAAAHFRLMFVSTLGKLVLNNLTLENGIDDQVGGGAILVNYFSQLEVHSCKFTNNAASTGSGGAIHVGSKCQTRIFNTLFSGNDSYDDGGAIYNVLSDLHVEDSRFTMNQVNNQDPANTSGETGGAAIFIDGADVSQNKGLIALIHTVFDSNTSTNNQGRFTSGGALYAFAYNSNVFSIDGCYFKNNSTLTFGAGAFISGGPFKGGKYNANINVLNSTFENNLCGGQGGGVWIGGLAPNKGGSSKVNVTNCTFYQNSSDEYGGALVTILDGINVLNCTFAKNQAQKNGGSIFTPNTFNINNCIFYSNTSAQNPNGNHCNQSFQGNHNIQFPAANTQCTSGILSVDPLLGPLQDNGGPTLTMALLEGSPAIDAGNKNCLISDQRGLYRFGTCDIGAFEYHALDTMPNTTPTTELPVPFNLLTPNGDGQNDTWQIDKLDVLESYQIQVFTQNGQIVLQSNQYNQDWDGTFQGKPLPQGIYYYAIIISGQKKPLTGYITLIR